MTSQKLTNDVIEEEDLPDIPFSRVAAMNKPELLYIFG